MFLSQPELETLTGYKRKSAQSAWLYRNGIRHWRNRLGDVVVPRSALELGQKVERAEKVFSF